MKASCWRRAVQTLFAQVLDGVEAAHLQGVVHRDLKPENVLHDPKAKLLLVADFGVADFAQEDLYTLVETKPGTRLANFQYAAPEQRERGGKCDQRTDIFALGLILNEMFTNAIPQGSGYRTVASTAPDFAWVDDLIAWMIRQNPAERPDTIEVVKRELIGRRNVFVEQQRVSALKSTVIPVTELDDPVLADPIRLIGADWERGVLTLKLSQPVNPNWIQAFLTPFSHEAILGKGPEAFQLRGDSATVGVRSDDAQRAIDYFKTWLGPVHHIYARRLQQARDNEARQRREALEREIREREERQSVLSRIKI